MTGNISIVKITHVLYICNCIIVILYIPRHVVRVNKYLLSYLITYLLRQNEASQLLFLDVSTMRTFVYQFGIALRDA